MIFLFPLVLSVLAALLFLIGDASWVAKGIVASLAAGAFLLQSGAGDRGAAGRARSGPVNSFGAD